MISDRQHTKIASHIWAQSRASALQVDRLRFRVMGLLSRALPPNQPELSFWSHARRRPGFEGSAYSCRRSAAAGH
jgi:hypothetical protein